MRGNEDWGESGGEYARMRIELQVAENVGGLESSTRARGNRD